jgi:hypothetical protein
MPPSLQQKTSWLRTVADEARLNIAIVVIVVLLLGALLGLVGTLLSSIIKDRMPVVGRLQRPATQN